MHNKQVCPSSLLSGRNAR